MLLVVTGFAVWAIDRLGFGGALLPEKDGQHDHGGDGQELTLPVLQRLEPELGGPEVLHDRHAFRLPVRRLFLVVFAAPPTACNSSDRETGRQMRVRGNAYTAPASSHLGGLAPGAPGRRGSGRRSTSSCFSGSFDSADPLWNRMAVSIT